MTFSGNTKSSHYTPEFIHSPKSTNDFIISQNPTPSAGPSPTPRLEKGVTQGTVSSLGNPLVRLSDTVKREFFSQPLTAFVGLSKEAGGKSEMET